MEGRTFTVLFLSQRNSVRSIFAEAYVNSARRRNLKAFSAGPRPRGQIDPLAVAVLRDSGMPTDNLRSKGWNEFDGRKIDIVINLCAEDTSNDPCGRWPVKPSAAYWTTPDPVAAKTSDEEKRDVYVETLLYVKQRVDYLFQFDESQLENIAKRESRGLPKRRPGPDAARDGGETRH